MGTTSELLRALGGNGRMGWSARARLWAIAGLLCAGGAGVGCGGATDEPRCEGGACQPLPQSCLADATSYANGSSRPAGDGCNSCTCSDGQWECTTLGCLGDACVYGGQIRPDGSSFPALDGCNQCSCADGQVACTERGCVGEPPPCELGGQLLASGATAPAADGCNSCSCIEGVLQCTLIDCAPDCYSDGDCGETQYCAFPVSTCASYGFASGSADRETEEQRAPGGQAPLPPGQCRDRPTLCAAEETPVCGCDGQTYRSECAAASLGLNLASTGACVE